MDEETRRLSPAYLREVLRVNRETSHQLCRTAHELREKARRLLDERRRLVEEARRRL